MYKKLNPEGANGEKMHGKRGEWVQKKEKGLTFKPEETRWSAPDQKKSKGKAQKNKSGGEAGKVNGQKRKPRKKGRPKDTDTANGRKRRTNGQRPLKEFKRQKK